MTGKVATGPLLNFDGTPGLGPEHHTSFSIYSPPHAIEARDAYLATISRMEKGEKMRILVGTGHGMATCQGAVFEYLSTIHSDLEFKAQVCSDVINAGGQCALLFLLFLPTTC